MSISKQDKALFTKSIGQVKRLVSNQREPERIVRPCLSERRNLFIEEQITYKKDMMSDETLWIDDQDDFSSYLAPGVQKRVLKKLTQGKIAPELALDLHGLTKKEASQDLSAFLSYAKAHHSFCIEIIHGQGYNSSKTPVLRGLVYRWLRFQEEVLAFGHPPQRLGGKGTTFVLLKKPRP